jgi:hypothetical protein
MVIAYSNRKCVVVSTLQSLTSATFAHIVKYFFTVMIYLDLNIFVGGLIGLLQYYRRSFINVSLKDMALHLK